MFAELVQHVVAGAEPLTTLFSIKACFAVLMQRVLADAEYFATGVVVVLHFLCAIGTPNVLLTQHVLAGDDYVRSTRTARISGGPILGNISLRCSVSRALLAVVTQHVLAGAEHFAAQVVVLHLLCCIGIPRVLLTQHVLTGAELVRSARPACIRWH
jgi:hypothetical protein